MLAFCLRVGVGVHAARAIFFVTLGTVSSSDRTCSEALGLARERVHTAAGLLRALSTVTASLVVDGRKSITGPRPWVATMQSYYEKNSPRAQRSVTLIIPHANTPLGQIGPVPSSPVPSSPGSSVGGDLQNTAPALLLLAFVLGRRTSTSTRRSPPRRRGVPTASSR